MTRPLRLGLLGTGNAARKLYWPALRTLVGRVDLVAVANRTRAKAEAFARDFDVPYVAADAKELFSLPQLDAVLLSLPIEELPKHVLLALKAGKHVLSEKPVAGSLAEGRALLKAAAPFQRRGLRWMVTEDFAHLPALAQAERWLAEGRLGDLRLVEARQCRLLSPANPYYNTAWRRKPRFVGGFVLDAGVHVAHVVRRCFGLPTEIRGLSTLYNPGAPPIDTALAALRFPSGALGTWTSCFALHQETPLFVASGTKAALELWTDRAILRPWKGQPKSFRASGDGFTPLFHHFADAVLKGTALRFTPPEALADLALIQGVVQGRALRP
jgi:predicted dehydrogenase